MRTIVHANSVHIIHIKLGCSQNILGLGISAIKVAVKFNFVYNCYNIKCLQYET